MTTTAALIARFALALVFLSAGGAKLASLQSFRKALNGFGIPEPATAPLGFVLAAAEILTGILLLPAATAAQAAAAALTLSAIFAAAVLIALARGKRPDCHCFGNLYSKPISKSTLARIGALAATAAFVAWAATKSNPEPVLTSLSPSTIALLALTTVLAAALVAASAAYARLLKKYGATLLELEAAKAATPAATRPAPDFSLPTISGTTTTLASLLANRRPLLLVFSDPACPTCQFLMPQLEAWEQTHADRATVAVITTAGTKAIAKAARPKHYLIQHQREVAEAYGAPGVPSAVIVDPGGEMQLTWAKGPDEIMRLAESLLNAAQPFTPDEPPSRVPVTHLAPDAVFRDLDDNPVALASTLGRDTLIVFWSPGCPHSRELERELAKYEHLTTESEVRLVVITQTRSKPTGILGQGLTLLDPEARLSKALGVTVTPAAVVIDGNGQIASVVAAGTKNVLDIAGAVIPA